VRKVFSGRRRTGQDQAPDPVAVEQQADSRFQTISPVGSWMWLILAGTMLIQVEIHDLGSLGVTVVGILSVGAAWRYEKAVVAQRRAIDGQARYIARLEEATASLVQKSIDLEHAGWITPERNVILIETMVGGGTRHQVPPTGSQPFYFLPGPASEKWLHT
jgi:hypothetical protein